MPATATTRRRFYYGTRKTRVPPGWRGPLYFFNSLLAIFLVACGSPEPRDLTSLVVRDSLYVEPASGEPYTGPVFRGFPDDGEGARPQLEGALHDGTWDGELRVYHPNGRIRYMGSFHAGSRCGPWTENADSTRNESIYEALIDEIESLGVYPPCPER